jgi:hypothetical protein
MTKTILQPLEFVEGQICMMEWGATMSLVDFFQVTRRTEKTVWFKKVPSIIHTHDGYGQAGTKLPDLETTERGAEFRKKINVDEDGSETAYETYRGTIQPWTGQPINFDTYD